MSVRFIAYDEPIFDQHTGQMIGNKIKAITEQEAIKIQKETVAKVKQDFVYKDDQQALNDFITVNWAWYVDLG
jgi:hypothetical protein